VRFSETSGKLGNVEVLPEEEITISENSNSVKGVLSADDEVKKTPTLQRNT
jgi:hypothetical protein